MRENLAATAMLVLVLVLSYILGETLASSMAIQIKIIISLYSGTLIVLCSMMFLAIIGAL